MRQGCGYQEKYNEGESGSANRSVTQPILQGEVLDGDYQYTGRERGPTTEPEAGFGAPPGPLGGLLCPGNQPSTGRV
jgi:hypothetical protein